MPPTIEGAPAPGGGNDVRRFSTQTYNSQPNALKAIVRVIAIGTLALAASLMMIAQTPSAAPSSVVTALLTRARTQEQTGHIDLAAQTWQQVLLVNANDPEALAGLARSAKLAGNEPSAKGYLDRLRRVAPNSPDIAKIETTSSAKAQTSQLQKAAQLAQAGHAEEALRIYRSVWGNRPPDGDWALAYYDTEAGTEVGRADAISSLGALAARYPADARYGITLGRILTYNPKTRVEGLQLLNHFPHDPAAQQAVRQAHLWDVQNPNAAQGIRAYLQQHPDEQIAQSLAEAEATHARTQSGEIGIPRGTAETAAFAALAAGRTDDAQQRFLALQLEQPDNPRVLAGLGFLRMKQNNFPAAIEFLDGAQKHGLRRRDIDEALKTSRFWATVQHGTAALNADRLDEAEGAYKSALMLRPGSVDALNGLSGTYMKAGQPAQAVPVYQQIVKLQPKSADAWRGLFNAQVQSGQPADALETARRLPVAIKAELQRSIEYLRSLASAYTANGQPGEAKTTLDQALSLPLPDNRGKLNTEVQLQYAGLLSDAGRYAQAVGLYRDIIDVDPDNVPAWQGLMSMQHRTGHDAEALATIQRMSPETYEEALQGRDFLAMMASIYQQLNRFDLAQQLLARAAASYVAKGQPAPIQLQVQIAAIALQQNNPQRAYAVFRSVLSSHPESVDAWKGLLSALHQTHRDREALAQLRQIPTDVRRQLDRDIDYEQTVAAVYAATGNSPAALQVLSQIQAHYRALHGIAPAEIDLQDAWLLYSTHDDRDLYRALMDLGGREDLSDAQRLVGQTIWATWSVRRAGEAVDAGNPKRSVEILRAAYQAFPNNADVSKALAGGYLKAGDPKRAMAIFLALHIANPTAPDYQVMISAAIAAPDLHQAELWLRDALEKFPNDPQVLGLAARFEQARGDHTRAAAYLKASLAAMPAVDPTNRLAHVLDRADQAPSPKSADLASLLDPSSETAMHATRPPLPSYGNTYANALSSRPSPTSPTNSLYGPDPYLLGMAPVPLDGPAPPADGTASSGRLGNYLPGDDSSLTRATDGATARDAGHSESGDAFAPPQRFTNDLGSSQTASQPDTRNMSERPTHRGPESLAEPVAPIEPNVVIHSLNSSVPRRSSSSNVTLELTSSALPSNAVYLLPQTAPQAPAAAPRTSQSAPQQQITIQNQTIFPDPEVTAEVGVTDMQLQQQSLPPLRGPWGQQTSIQEPDPRSETENQLAVIDAGYSPWRGGTGYISHRTGTAGFDQLEILEAPFEASTTMGGATRLTAVVLPSLLDSGVADGSSTDQLGTLAAGAKPAQQNSAGVGGEAQLTTANLGLSAGTTPRGFLVPNITARISVHPASGPLTLNFVREGIKDSQLSYAGLRDPGSISSTYAGNIWGGVVSNAANVQYSRGDDASGYYAGIGGQYITGLNVLTNNRIDGVAGAYWKVLKIPETGDFTIGANFFGMHYAHNLRYFTYGQGGYFSPSVYFLANIPFTFNGQYGPNIHYTVAGALGLQAFQEDTSLYYPTHVYAAPVTAPVTTPTGVLARSVASAYLRPLPPTAPTVPVTPFSNPSYPAQSVVGSNYDLHAEISDHVVDRWYIGGFISLNNTRDYANQTIGFFIRYMTRAQDLSEGEPSGLFPYQGFRPLLVP
jgi:tetratricopeptide (TPR) repeat protein